MIKIALPSKGQLYEPTVNSLLSSGYDVKRSGQRLSCADLKNNIEFYFIRPADIPLYISRGTLDGGITGKDFVLERGNALTPLLDLDYGFSKLCLAVPEDAPVNTIEEASTYAIATSFPNISRALLPNLNLQLIVLEGSVEVSIRLGIAQAIIDIVETGQTLREEGLRKVGEPLFECNAALFAHPDVDIPPELVTLKNRLEGTVVARAYVMIDYDVPEDKLVAACAATPALESPTVMPLHEKGWFAVRSTIPKKNAHQIMDRLSILGCKGILLTKIENARI